MAPVLVLFNISVMCRPLVQEIEEERKKMEKSCNVRNGPRKEREKQPTNEGPAYGVWLHM